jgi:intraflagellar transport protein 172
MSRQVDGAIQHYIEAGAYASAVTAALESKQIVRAAQLVEDTMRDPATARPFYLQIARHYQATSALEEAEKYYVKAGEPAHAVDMYIAVGRWESSYAIARQVRQQHCLLVLYLHAYLAFVLLAVHV